MRNKGRTLHSDDRITKNYRAKRDRRESGAAGGGGSSQRQTPHRCVGTLEGRGEGRGGGRERANGRMDGGERRREMEGQTRRTRPPAIFSRLDFITQRRRRRLQRRQCNDDNGRMRSDSYRITRALAA
ncbi:hypothetical protein Trydic_g5290 [Trypoxylus dichotomus]